MRQSLPWLGFMALLVVTLSAFADDTDATAKPDTKDKKQYDKLTKSGKSFKGKLVKIDGDKRLLTVEVPYTTTRQDPQIVKNLHNLQVQMVDAQRNKNPVERLRQMNHIQVEVEKNQLNLFKEATLKVELDAPDNVQVRTLVLPVELDDKGKPRKLTEKEKKELKGPDPTLRGYTADFDSFKSDQIVEVYLAKQPPKSKAKDKDADTTESTRPKIAMIIILAEPTK